MGARHTHKLAALEVGERRLNRASRESGGVGDFLMRLPRRPVRPLRSLSVQIQISDEGCRPAIMADDIRHKRIQDVSLQRELFHAGHYISN